MQWPVLGVVVQTYYVNRTGLVPVLGVVLQIYCANGAVSVPVLGVVLQMCCVQQRLTNKKNHL